MDHDSLSFISGMMTVPRLSRFVGKEVYTFHIRDQIAKIISAFKYLRQFQKELHDRKDLQHPLYALQIFPLYALVVRLGVPCEGDDTLILEVQAPKPATLTLKISCSGYLSCDVESEEINYQDYWRVYWDQIEDRQKAMLADYLVLLLNKSCSDSILSIYMQEKAC